MTNKVPTGLRLPQERLDLLRKLAKEENRSLNNFLETIIEQYLKDSGKG